MARARWFCEYLVVRLFVCLLQALSMDACASLAAGMAYVCHDWLRLRRAVVDENLRNAFPQWSERQRRRLARRMWEHLFLMLAEIAHAPRKIHRTNWRQFIAMERIADHVRMLFDERPTMIVTAHFGNFELAGYVLGLLGFPTYSVARDLDNPHLHDFIHKFRGQTGQQIVPKKGGYDQIVSLLSRRETMAFLADQYAGSKGCWVTFFGRPASAHKAIALFALNHQARVLVSAARRVERPLHFEIELHGVALVGSGAAEVQGVRELTQWYSSVFESMIRRAPEQYWWLHRRWKDKRRSPAARRAAA